MSDVIEISPLTRVEGNGIVRLYLDGRRAERVELALIEPPRLFEALLLGKRFDEVPEIICRICSLCSTVHRVTSLLAVEKALGIEVSPETRLYRELIVYGGQIQSHALHLFCLALPDYCNAAGFADLAAKAPDLLKLGLRIKGVGNLIQETVGGRLIHPVNVIPGGMGKRVGQSGLKKMREALEEILQATVEACDLFASFGVPAPALPLRCFMAVQGETAPPFFGDRLASSSGSSFPVADYREALPEEVVAHSHAKRSRVEDGEVIVGALARLNTGMRLTPMADKAFLDNRERLISADIRGNNLAQAVELIMTVECALERVAHLLSVEGAPESIAVTPRKGSGTAATEAPRGVLIHSYGFDGRGYCTAADIITPTAINQAAMEHDLLALAREMEGADDAELSHRLEMLVRAYDPCISCAVHLVRL